MKSWRTTVCGILTAVAALIPAAKALIDGDPATVVDTNEIMVGIMGLLAAFGFAAARDNKVSSEDAGAK